MSARTKVSDKPTARRPEPWWTKFVLALVKLWLAFALAVLTLLLSRQGSSSYGPDGLNDPGVPVNETVPEQDLTSTPP
jgi:hypothetical protein